MIDQDLPGLQSFSVKRRAHKQGFKLQAGRLTEQCYACTCSPTTPRRLVKRIHSQMAPRRLPHLRCNSPRKTCR